MKARQQTVVGPVDLPLPTVEHVVPVSYTRTAALPYVATAHKHAGET